MQSGKALTHCKGYDLLDTVSYDKPKCLWKFRSQNQMCIAYGYSYNILSFEIDLIWSGVYEVRAIN